MADAPPCQTLYLRNLTDKLSKEKLRRQLFNICSKFGSILDIVVRPGQAMRGQAWVVFVSVEVATKALNRLNDYPFFQKPIKASFAKENSDVIAKLEGRYVAREKKAAKEEEERPTKRMRPTEDSTPAASGGGHDSNNPPGPILKIDNIPDDATKEDLIAIFSKYDGYLDVRHYAPKNLAFVEYRTTESAKVARDGLKGYQMSPTHKLRVNFGKPSQ